jgi:aspartate/glutamate racemase
MGIACEQHGVCELAFNHFSKASAFCAVIRIVELQSVQCVICGCFTELFAVSKTMFVHLAVKLKM